MLVIKLDSDQRLMLGGIVSGSAMRGTTGTASFSTPSAVLILVT